MLENRSFDHMLGFFFADRGNQARLGQPFAGLTGDESNRDASGASLTVFEIDPDQSERALRGPPPPWEGRRGGPLVADS